MAPSTANSERRKNARRTPPSLIYVELGPSNGGMMRDLSAEGFSLRAMMPVQTGQQTPFSFALNANARIEGQGKILWIEENGRVAGIRFVEVPAQAHALLQSWIDGTLENPEPEKPALGGAQSFEELREELRGPLQPRREPTREPSTKPHWALRPSAQQEQQIPNTDASGAIPESKPLHEEETETEAATHEPVEYHVKPEPFAGLPHFTTEGPVEIRFEPLRDQRAHETPAAVNAGPVAREERSNRLDASILPDISDILIQPPMSEKTPGWQPSLSEFGEGQTAKGNGTEWFTLSRAIGIMALLALAVAFSVYHQEFGEGLIWLGRELGGSAATPASPPTAEDKPASSETNSAETSSPPSATTPASPPTAEDKPASSETNSAETSSPPSATTPPTASTGTSKPDPSLGGTHPLGTTVPSLPQTSKNSVASADVASTGQPDSAVENGSAEYAHAVQLLHDKNRHADLSEAVRLLWISVEKGNPGAELTLAELYWRGEGVAHNCDQARILLSAAARKGNADAKKRLGQFEREGCE
jgi:hypothetical protein